MNIDDILKQLHEAQNEPSPEELFRQKLAASDPKLAVEEDNVIEEETKEAEEVTEAETEEATEEVAEETTEEAEEEVAEEATEEVAEETKEAETEEENLDEEKEVIAQLDAQGRIMARAFMSELEKLSSAQDFEVNDEIEETDEAEEMKLAESRVRILEKIYFNLNPEDNE